MKLCVVNFSISNGGDYLIEKRMNDLVCRTWPEAEIDYINGVDTKFTESSKYDAVLFGGGPYYDDRIVETLLYPFFDGHLDDNVFHMIGCGVYGENCLDDGIYTKRFNDRSLDFFNKIINNGGTLCCRDELSWRILNNNGLNNTYVTGCPAWYDFDYLDNTDVKEIRKIRKIMISDPGVTKNPDEQEIRAEQAVNVIEMICKMFPDASFVFSFNNGINTKYSYKCNHIIRDYLQNKGIEFIDISGGITNFDVYNDADLHIGFRVHSHIYSLSRRIPSILIEEDLRGWGMNEVLGLPHLLSYNISKMYNNKAYSPNVFLINHLEDILRYNMNTRFINYHYVFERMKEMYYKEYVKWANNILK